MVSGSVLLLASQKDVFLLKIRRTTMMASWSKLDETKSFQLIQGKFLPFLVGVIIYKPIKMAEHTNGFSWGFPGFLGPPPKKGTSPTDGKHGFKGELHMPIKHRENLRRYLDV